MNTRKIDLHSPALKSKRGVLQYLFILTCSTFGKAKEILCGMSSVQRNQNVQRTPDAVDTLEAMFAAGNNLQKQYFDKYRNMLRKAELRVVEAELTELRSLGTRITNHMTECYEEIKSRNQQFETDRKRYEDQIKVLETKLAQYIPIESKSIAIILPSTTDEKQTDDNDNAVVLPFAEDTLLCSKHMAIMMEWSEETQRLQTLQSIGTAPNDDDEKGDMGSNKMIEKYFETQTFLQSQLQRINMVMGDQYLGEVMNRQQALSVSATECDEKCELYERELISNNEECRSLTAQREELQNHIKSLATECNEFIKMENAAIEIRNQTAKQLNDDRKERGKISASATRCLSVIEAYNKFIENNKEYIETINANFDAFWAAFESQWMEWRTENIIVWFKFKTSDMDTSNVDWETVQKQLQKRNITGKSLQKFSDLTFEFLEIHDFEVVQHLLSAIDELKSRLSRNNQFRREAWKASQSKTVPQHFLCPLTKKIMQDPVLAFDGQCYERKAIEEYLKSHRKSPVTGKDADYIIVFPDLKRKADIEKFMKENSDIISSVLPQEGVPDTNYI